MRVTKSYDESYRVDAVRLARRGDRTIMQVAQDLGVNHWTLRGWCKQEDMSRRKKALKNGLKVPGEETPEQKLARLERENERLQRENETLKMDREILKKAAAFFAKEKE
ncbi:MAG TPA: transposase [Polyangiaceae bacterium]|nr:transposase [Polyangiaceae bacterium]